MSASLSRLKKNKRAVLASNRLKLQPGINASGLKETDFRRWINFR